MDKESVQSSGPDDMISMKSVIHPVVTELDKIYLQDDSPNIQYLPLSIDMEMSTFSNPYSFADQQGYMTPFVKEVELFSKIENLLDQGRVFIGILYSFRSVSKAIPEVVR